MSSRAKRDAKHCAKSRDLVLAPDFSSATTRRENSMGLKLLLIARSTLSRLAPQQCFHSRHS